jgi:DNA integrity scanning protein DisA with diadenylate cyclase activity
MVVQIRGIIQHLSRVSWDNNRVLRLGVPYYEICGYHNLNCEKHVDSKSEASSYWNVLKHVIIRKGSTVQNAEDKNVTPKDYRMLYRFPHIAVCGFVNKVKKHFTTMMAVGVPASYLLRLMDIISTDTCFIFISQGML